MFSFLQFFDHSIELRSNYQFILVRLRNRSHQYSDDERMRRADLFCSTPFLSVVSDSGRAVQAIPPQERVGHLVSDQHRAVREEHGVCSILSPVGWLLGHSGRGLER
jgi:hypothetical protein